MVKRNWYDLIRRIKCIKLFILVKIKYKTIIKNGFIKRIIKIVIKKTIIDWSWITWIIKSWKIPKWFRLKDSLI